MLRLPAACGLMLTVLILAAPGAQANAPHSAEQCAGYPPDAIPTEVSVDVDAEIDAGTKVRARIAVRSNHDGPVTGTLRVRVERPAGAGQAMLAAVEVQRTYEYSGAPIDADLGVLPRGIHVLSVAFEPDDACHLASNAQVSFRVVAGGGVEEGPDGLPDTGGPPWWWMLLAALLLAAGAVTVDRARRRSL